MTPGAAAFDADVGFAEIIAQSNACRMDQAAFRSFYQKTAPNLRAYIQRRCGSADIADDIFQETFLRFLRSAPDLPSEAAMRGYLYRTAESSIADHWRRKRREREWTIASLFWREPPPPGIADDMTRAFNQLKPQQRLLLWLAYVEGLDHREIAAAARVKERSVRVLLFRARKALEGILKRAGIGPEVA